MHLLFNLYLQTLRSHVVPETLDSVICSPSRFPHSGKGRDGGHCRALPHPTLSRPKLCNETSLSLSPSFTWTCQVRGAGSHAAAPGPRPRWQPGPSRGRFPRGARLDSRAAVPTRDLGGGACWLSLSTSSGFQLAAGSGVVTGVVPRAGGSHPWWRAAHEEDAAEEGAPEGHGQQGQHHGLGRAAAAGAGGRGGLGGALRGVGSRAGAPLRVQHGRRGASGTVQRGAAAAGVTGRMAARADPQGRRGWAPRFSRHRLLGVVEVPRWAVGEAEVAQDVGGALAFCTRAGHVYGAVRPVTCCPGLPAPCPRPHTHTARLPPPSRWAMRPRALTLAWPLCVPLHTRAAGHLGARGPRCHVLGCPIEQQRVAVQRSWAGVVVGTGRRGKGCRQPRPAILGPHPPQIPRLRQCPGLPSTICALVTRHLLLPNT